MVVRLRAAWVFVLLLGTSCGGAQRTGAGDVIGTTMTARPTASGSPVSSTRYVVPEPARLKSDELRCHGRALSEVPYERSLPAAMSQVERVEKIARTGGTRPIFLGVRQCGTYRAVTMGDRFTRTKLVYDARGDLVAAFASSDVVEQKCLVNLDEWTAHYGRAVDCTESELVFPRE